MIATYDISLEEFLPNGVFFDDAKNKNILDVFPGTLDGREGHPRIRSSISYVQSNDGTSRTLMISESVHTWFWAYDGDVTTAEYEPVLRPDRDAARFGDTKHVFGFVWSNSGAQVERINGDNDYRFGAPPDQMSLVASPPFLPTQAGTPQVTHFFESYSYPSSRHPGGVNIAFCDGHIVFLNEDTRPNIYAMLMTSNRKRSKYWDPESGLPDRKLTQPSDADL